MAVQPYNANDPYEALIANMIAVERQPQIKLRGEKSEQEIFKGVLSDFDTTLSELHTGLKALTDAFTNPFAARTAEVPEGAGFRVATTDAAAAGAHTLSVTRLAATDTRVSKRFGNEGTELRAFFDQNGPQTFTVEVASPTADDPDRRVGVPVTVDPTGATDEEVLAEIRAGIAAAMDTAADNGDIERKDAAAASVVNETADTARLSLRSGDTGYASRLAFTDSADGLLALLEVGAATTATGTGGGQITAVGTSEDTSELNAAFDLDGLTLYRGSNEVDDALEGITLTLTSASESPVAFSVGADTDGIAEEVEGFIKQYNAVLDFIKKKTKVDGEAGTRGDFAGDSSVRGLRFGLRTDALAPVSGLAADAPASLTALGIEVEDDGTLKLADREALRAAVERDPEAVQQLFAADNGVGTKMLSRLDAFLETDGILDNRRDVVESRIKRLDTRITDWDDKLSRREEQLRLQFAELQNIIASVQSQSQFLSAYLY